MIFLYHEPCEERVSKKQNRGDLFAFLFPNSSSRLALYDKNDLTIGLNFDNIMETFPNFTSNFLEKSPKEIKTSINHCFSL
jgi:hypothetical protein